MLSIWRPADDLQNMLKEGHRFKIYNLLASEGRGRSTGGISLTTGRTTRYEQMAVDDNLADLIYEPREVSSTWLKLSLLPAVPSGHTYHITITVGIC